LLFEAANVRNKIRYSILFEKKASPSPFEGGDVSEK
jgi:hypothetical protein